MRRVAVPTAETYGNGAHTCVNEVGVRLGRIFRVLAGMAVWTSLDGAASSDK
jgi:hypothetical protein